MHSLIFLDLDGTLWEREWIPDSALQAIHTAQKNGHKVFCNTGRTRASIPNALFDIGLDGYCFGAGSQILYDDNVVAFYPLDAVDILSVRDILDQLDVPYTLEGAYKNYMNQKNIDFFNEHGFFNKSPERIKRILLSDTLDEEGLAQIQKMFVRFSDKKILEPLLKKLPHQLIFTEMHSWGGEITHKLHNKATVIETVRQLFDEPVTTIAIGDSQNDNSMIQAADIGVAMGNAHENTKKIASLITTAIDEDGLYNAFNKLKLL